MAIEGDGLTAIKLMWGLLAMTIIVVSLRAYTRIFVVRSYGADDNVYNLAFLFLFLYTVFITVSARFGFGQNTADVREADRVKAILWELIGQTCAILGTAIAKVSLGLFLQRIVTGFATKVVIWTAMGILMGASVSTCFVLWLQCWRLWDTAVAPGFQAIERELLEYAATHQSQIGSTPLANISSVPEEDTVGLIVWTAAEMAVTLICIGIPASRSLCKQFRDRLVSEYNSDYKKKVQQLYGLRRISWGQGQGQGAPRRLEEGDNIVDASIAPQPPPPVSPHRHHHIRHHDVRAMGLGGPYATTSLITGPRRVQCYNKSDEQVLLESPAPGQDAGIRITEEFHVTRT